MGEKFHISDTQNCGAVLTKLRTAAGRSARSVALDSGVSLASLLQWEKGLHMPTLPKLDLLLRFYGATATIGYPVPDEVEVQT